MKHYFILSIAIFNFFFTVMVSASMLIDPTRPFNWRPVAPVQENDDMEVEAVKIAVPKEWHVSFLLYSSQRKIAIINNKIVKIGEEVEGAKVTAIRPNGVTLVYQQTTLTIPFMSINIKSPK